MNPNPNSLLSTAEQMKRNNANLAREDTNTADSPNLIRPKNPSAAKSPTGSTSHPEATKSANSSSTNPKHPLSLDKVATSAEKHRQVTKQARDIATILGTKTIDVEKAYKETTIATNAALQREAEKDEETTLILEKAFKADAEGDKVRADMFYKIYAKMVTSKDGPSTPQEHEEQRRQAEARIGKKNTVAGGTNFNWGDANSHDDVGFTPFFDKNILELKGPLPLTIFNKA
ncbi:hypothetical protein PGT21_015034 [Puccinia graminis f. sp. tritici]|uniref:Uncharacterized protein n=1 Tax=Puccinia graminis f. sp. tritici TaxID=56615 RepID=A0A5B0Q2U4_PUCGR|nr:hypothetical protein PGT21_015034 [Puccinia graminis f. sp. tritici]